MQLGRTMGHTMYVVHIYTYIYIYIFIMMITPIIIIIKSVSQKTIIIMDFKSHTHTAELGLKWTVM